MKNFLIIYPFQLLITYFVCPFTRAKTLNLFKFVFHLAGGFTSKKQWEIILTKIACDICKSIMTLSTIDTWLVVSNCSEIFFKVRINFETKSIFVFNYITFHQMYEVMR